MHPRARDLIRSLDLQPHPEGGWYREVWRAARAVPHPVHGAPRPAGTAILFLLAGDGASRWHRLASDEVWQFIEGEPAELFHTADGRRTLVAPLDAVDRAAPLPVVPAGHWQAARTVGAYTLVSCTVTPGFDFADFTLLRHAPADLAALRAAGWDPLDLL